ncbi:MAG: hypothetical protein ACF8XB_07400 [Planctomycetota bacterium JB042]
MAPTPPLFVEDLETLKAELRLNGIASDADAGAILNSAILEVRLGLIRELTKSRIDTIRETAFNEEPSTNEEVLRALGNTVETTWVRIVLMDTLPSLFLDSSGDAEQVWNEEGLFRGESTATLDDKRRRLWRKVQEDLELLRGDESIGAETSVRATTLEPDPPYTPQQKLPGSSAGIVL